MKKTTKKEIGMGLLFLAPALILICGFTVWPIIQAVITSFHSTQYAAMGGFVGFKNYISICKDGTALLNILNSVIYVVLSLVIAIPLGVGIGSLLNRKIHGITLLRTLIIIPWTLSQTVTALLWKWLLNGNYGLATYWTYALTGSKVDLFSNRVLARLLVVLANVWNSCPVVIILTIAALQTIPEQLIEAAKVDGANQRETYFKITLPLIRPTISTVIVMQSIEYFNMVTLLYVLTAGGPFNATQTLSLAAYQNAFQYWHLDVASAFSIIIFLFNIAFSLLYVKLLRRSN